VLVTQAVCGCSTDADKRYRTLSFFFDGVPNPHAPAGSAAARGESDEFAPNAPVINAYVHKPYADGKCTSCHTGAAGGYESYTAVGSDVCLKCHKDKLTQYPVMHGPVVAVECTICHAAHESTIPGMLNYDAPKVCVQCHERGLLSATPPEHLAADSKCLSCHVGHGGPAHKLLRAQAPATRPAGRPAGAGA
jgi:predicted CXXCH cytochrome family protein